jgi:hypothetical protein
MSHSYSLFNYHEKSKNCDEHVSYFSTPPIWVSFAPTYISSHTRETGSRNRAVGIVIGLGTA